MAQRGWRLSIAAAIALVPALALAQPAESGRRRTGGVASFLNDLVGQNFWLKIDVIRVQHPLGGQDATNIYRDGNVSYRALIGSGLRSTVSTDAEEFTKEVQRIALQDKKNISARVWRRGARVTVHDFKAKGDEVFIDITDVGGSKTRVRLKFEDGPYDLEDVERVFAVGFAESEAETKGADATVALELGMPADRVIALKGKPKTQVNLGKKTILTYEDMKLIFENDRLVDVQ